MEIQIIMFTTRAVILILNTIIGGLSIYLGWRLYFETVRADSKVEINSGSIKFVIQSAAPGLFFVAFGIFLLIYVLSQKVEIQSHEVASNQAPAQTALQYSPYYKASDFMTIAGTQASPTAKCMFNERSLAIKWADESDPRSNKVKIHAYLTDAISSLKKQLDAEGNNDDPKLEATINGLLVIDDGFQQ